MGTLYNIVPILHGLADKETTKMWMLMQETHI